MPSIINYIFLGFLFGSTLLFHLRIRDLYYMLMVPNAGSKKKVTAFLVMVFSQLIGFTAVLYVIYSFGTVADYKVRILINLNADSG